LGSWRIGALLAPLAFILQQPDGVYANGHAANCRLQSDCPRLLPSGCGRDDEEKNDEFVTSFGVSIFEAVVRPASTEPLSP
jgi:hypothetical protein